MCLIVKLICKMFMPLSNLKRIIIFWKFHQSWKTGRINIWLKFKVSINICFEIASKTKSFIWKNCFGVKNFNLKKKIVFLVFPTLLKTSPSFYFWPTRLQIIVNKMNRFPTRIDAEIVENGNIVTSPNYYDRLK